MVTDYHERYGQLQDVEQEKNTLVKELLNNNQELQTALVKTRGRLEGYDTLELYHDRAKDACAELERLRSLIDRSAYICVLIDGDCMKFRDELVQDLRRGGRKAAQLLRSTITDYARGSTLDLQKNVEIIVYIYANVDRLKESYCDAQILQKPNDLDCFIGEFNKSHPQLNFINSGDGEDGSRAKICDTFKLQINNMHCRHLIIGETTDSGYPFLNTDVGDARIENRITLLKVSVAKELSSNFITKNFPEVFRTTQNGSFAKRRNSADRFLDDFRPPPAKIGSPQNAPFGKMARKAKRQRVDVPLSPPVQDEISSIVKRKLCNDFCLQGHCAKPRCKYEHAAHLTAMELLALRHVARSISCRAEPWCDDKDCYKGHRLPVNRCGLTGDRAWHFPADLHETDTKTVTFNGVNCLKENANADAFSGTNSDKTEGTSAENKGRLTPPMHPSLTLNNDTPTPFICDPKVNGK